MTTQNGAGTEPVFLIVPGLDNSGPTHWQSHWQRLLRNTVRADLGQWHEPERDLWVSRLDAGIRQIAGPVILCAHSLGCHAVAWWASRADDEIKRHVSGALLVAPPDCEREGTHPLLRRFAPGPARRFGFPALLAGSRDDHYATLGASRTMADRWGCEFVDTGALGHINAQSGIGHWPAGLALLGRVVSMAGLSRSKGLAAGTPAFT